MTATKQNFSFYQQEDVVIQITVTGKDLTGATITWVLGTMKGLASAVVLTKTTSSGISITNPTGGVFTVTLTKTDTAALAANSYYHQAEVLDSANVNKIVTEGSVVVYANATSAPS